MNEHSDEFSMSFICPKCGLAFVAPFSECHNSIMVEQVFTRCPKCGCTCSRRGRI